VNDENSRLRRLDALFAEKVLGRERATVSNSAELFYGDTVESGLPRYTRSLDAAWEGVRDKNDWMLSEEVCYDNSKDHVETPAGERFHAYVAPVGKCCMAGDEEDFYGVASHPAEALVLACLRAVGVDEDELV